jgi:hypothetical protein
LTAFRPSLAADVWVRVQLERLGCWHRPPHVWCYPCLRWASDLFIELQLARASEEVAAADAAGAASEDWWAAHLDALDARDRAAAAALSAGQPPTVAAAAARDAYRAAKALR